MTIAFATRAADRGAPFLPARAVSSPRWPRWRHLAEQYLAFGRFGPSGAPHAAHRRGASRGLTPAGHRVTVTEDVDGDDVAAGEREGVSTRGHCVPLDQV